MYAGMYVPMYVLVSICAYIYIFVFFVVMGVDQRCPKGFPASPCKTFWCLVRFSSGALGVLRVSFRGTLGVCRSSVLYLVYDGYTKILDLGSLEYEL